MEKLIINNFAGINNLEIELNKINLILGPQASGKSITAKLFFYFKSFFGEIKQGIEDDKSKREIDREHINKFNNYFPKETWPSSDFKIEYIINQTSMCISRTNGKPIRFNYTDDIKKIIKNSRKIFKKEQDRVKTSKRISHFEVSRNYSKQFNSILNNSVSEYATYNQIFIPAGRSFFSNIQSSIFTFLSSNKSLDPFLIQFGSFYESFKRFANDDHLITEKNIDKEVNNLVSTILNSDYLREKEKDYLLHSDKRKVNLSNASSGQQEILPLLIILKILLKISFGGEGAVLYIEEPEAHLFPNAQRSVVKLLARIFNSTENKFQFIVTTHSPYILTSFNNLMYAGSLINSKNNNEVAKIVPKTEIISPNDVFAYSLTLGKKLKNIIDKETLLISQNVLDEVSNEISIEFGQLLDLDE